MSIKHWNIIKIYCILEEYEEKKNDYHKIWFGVETITSGKAHEPYVCWTCNNEFQQECTGVNKCITGKLNSLPTDKQQISLIAHSSNYDCRVLLPFSKMYNPLLKTIDCYRLRQHIITLSLKRELRQ